jgi:carboxyl-terminal processing protease
MSIDNRGKREVTRAYKTILAVLVVGALLMASYGAGLATYWLIGRVGAQRNESEAQKLTVFWEAWHILDDEFLGEKPSDLERAHGATRGMVASFDDPYTVFVEPQPRELERDEMRGHFGGVGAWVSQDEEGQIVLAPMVERPAARAGVLEGDVLVAVDGTDITGMSTDEVVALIRGPVGRNVKLTVRRPGADELLEFEVRRERIELPTVASRMLEEQVGTGYVSIRLISQLTPRELAGALEDLKEQGANRLVLDLRHNPGGALSAAVEVASQFLAGGVVLYEQRQDGQEKPYRASANGLALDWPLVVLVDSASASGAEIIAGALQDRGRAPLIGEQTFGKGAVQHVHELTDGSSLHVTVARWLTPHRNHIDKQGLVPNETVTLTEDDVAAGRDPQLEKAIALLAESAS